MVVSGVMELKSISIVFVPRFDVEFSSVSTSRLSISSNTHLSTIASSKYASLSFYWRYIHLRQWLQACFGSCEDVAPTFSADPLPVYSSVALTAIDVVLQKVDWYISLIHTTIWWSSRMELDWLEGWDGKRGGWNGTMKK
jgi:hypothetical protein